MARGTYLKYVRVVIEMIDHPYFQAKIGENDIDTDIFKERFGRLLEAAGDRNIISKQGQRVLAEYYGVSGDPRALDEIKYISSKNPWNIKKRELGKLVKDRRTREIMNGLFNDSYIWPGDTLDWDVLDLAHGLHHMQRFFLKNPDIKRVRELVACTAGNMSHRNYFGDAVLRDMESRLAEHGLYLAGEGIAS